MKTAIFLPDDVFHAAERFAVRVYKSRSQLYAEALSEYLTRHAPEEATEAMNEALGEVENSPDGFLATAARESLARTEW